MAEDLTPVAEDARASERLLPDDPVLAELLRSHSSAAIAASISGPGHDVVTVERAELAPFMAAARDAGFTTFSDLCAVDYLTREPRYEVVVVVLSTGLRRRLVVRCGVPGDEPLVPSVTGVYPGANFYEREAWDLLGIQFVGHPDMTRILLPDEWVGHPLRKDEGVGSVPVQFKESHKAT